MTDHLEGTGGAETAPTTLAERVRLYEKAGLLEPTPRDVPPLPPALPIEPGVAQRWLQSDRESGAGQ